MNYKEQKINVLYKFSYLSCSKFSLRKLRIDR